MGHPVQRAVVHSDMDEGVENAVAKSFGQPKRIDRTWCGRDNDLIRKIIIEIKASKCLVEENEAQLLNYLKATKIEIGLLLNFGVKPEIKRKAYDNLRKHYSVNICGNLRPNFRIGG